MSAEVPAGFADDSPYFFAPVPTRPFAPPPAAKTRGRKRIDRIPFELDKKHENARQSLLRYFKKTMRKLAKACGSQAKRQQSVQKLFGSIYPQASPEDVERIVELLRQLRRTGVLHSNIKAKGFKSCCNAYVEWLFSSPEVKELYTLHTALVAGNLDKILRLPLDVTEEQRSKLLQFAFEIPGK